MNILNDIDGYVFSVRDYYATEIMLNDEAHQLTHVDEVCSLAIDYAIKFNYENINEVVLASYLHDLKVHVNRANHHLLGAEYCAVYANDDPFLCNMSIESQIRIQMAVLEHRASFKGKFTSFLSEIISAADRGKPEINSMIRRSVKYNAKLENDMNKVYSNVLVHIKDKFGRTGYAKFPKIYNELFFDELCELHNKIDNLTVEDIALVHYLNVDI